MHDEAPPARKALPGPATVTLPKAMNTLTNMSSPPVERELKALWERIATKEIPELGPGKREGTLRESDVLDRVDDFLLESRVPAYSHDLVRSAALLYHDHLGASHVLSQGIDNIHGSLLHGMMHRREPDYSNAKFWFRKTLGHPALARLSDRLEQLPLERAGWRERLFRGEEWNTLAFVDLCEELCGQDGHAWLGLGKQIQKIEFELFFEHILSVTGHPS